MDIQETVMTKIFKELRDAEIKHPGFPRDIVHGAAILNEEAGSVTKAALDRYYGRSLSDRKLIKEIAQVGAMSIRFLLRLLDPEHYPEQEKK